MLDRRIRQGLGGMGPHAQHGGAQPGAERLKTED